MHATIGHVSSTHRGVRASTAHTGRQSVRARRSAVLLRGVSTSETGGTIRSSTRSTTHGGRTHAEARGSVHWGREGGVGNDSSSSTASTATQTSSVLGKVVVSTTVLAALPVTSSERNHASSAAHVSTTHTMTVTAVTHVVLRRSHHARVTIAGTVSCVTHTITSGRTLLHRGEGAAETSSTTLEVGEATGRAVPVTRAGAVLARREWRDDVGSAVNDATGRR
jgi:hypothetical protein